MTLVNSGPAATPEGADASGADSAASIEQRVAASEATSTGRFLKGARRRVSHPAAWPWRWIFPLLTLACAAALPFLAGAAADAVLEGNAGQEVQTPTDPSEAGYVAFVEPTNTHLVIHVDDADQLVGASLISLRGEDIGGGTIVGIPAAFVAAAPGVENGEPLTVSYETGKADRVVEALSRTLGSQPLTFEVLTPGLWGSLISPVEGFEFSLIDDLSFTSADGRTISLDNGVVEVRADELLVLSSSLGNQPGIARARNIEKIWAGWVRAIQASDLGVEAIGGGSDQLNSIMANLTAGTVAQEALPATPFRPEGSAQPIYVPSDADQEAIAAIRRRVIPHVKTYEGAVIRTVQLINGTGDLTINQPAIDHIIENDALIQVISNAATFNIEATRIVYHDVADEEFVTTLADALGGAEIELFEVESPDNDVVVTLGSDYRPR